MFWDNNSNERFDSGDRVILVSGDSAGKQSPAFLRSRFAWPIRLSKDSLIADSLQRAPQTGDVYHIATSKPFRTGEYYDFQTKAEGYSKEQATAQLQNIAVVPNPYVGRSVLGAGNDKRGTRTAG